MEGEAKRVRRLCGPLLVFVSDRAKADTLAAIDAEPGDSHIVHIDGVDTEIHVVEYKQGETEFSVAVLPDFNSGSDVIDGTRALCAELNHVARVMLLIPAQIRRTIDASHLDPQFYLIAGVPDFEECLGITLTANQHRRLTRRIFQRNARRVVQVPLINILGALANAGVNMQLREDVQVPETRTALNEEWEKRLDEQPAAAGEDTACVICLTAERTVMLAPCRHQCVCQVCAKELLERDSQAKQCPVCRTEIKDIFVPIK